jgi:hypothetical protein|tara:strand:+ start:1309 stop:1533 length:225 start_codon:yes stop_codon:yes gene_type:complete
MEFTKDNYSIILEKYDNESYDIFFKRAEFILNNRNSNIKFDELILLSKIFTNNKFKNCKYSNDVIKKIKNLNYR